MLDLLPNEILHKIFSKTKPDTAKTCRLLNRRYDTFITEYGFNKGHIEMFRIHPSNFRMGIIYSVTVDLTFNLKKRITSDNFEEMLDILPQTLTKIGRIEHLQLVLVPINDKLLDILNQQKFLRFIRKLDIHGCTNKVENIQKWFSFLEKLNLQQFHHTASMEGQFLSLPTTVLDHVSKWIWVHSNIVNVLAEQPRITNNVVKKYLGIPKKRLQKKTIVPEKVLKFNRIITEMTLHGVIECIKMLMKRESENGYKQEFGILNNTTPEQVKRALQEARLRWIDVTNNPVFHDQVTIYEVKDGRRYYKFGCVDPGRVYGYQPVGLNELFNGFIKDH